MLEPGGRSEFGKILHKTPALQIRLSGKEAALLGTEETKKGCGCGRDIRAGEWSIGWSPGPSVVGGDCHQGLAACVIATKGNAKAPNL